MLVRALLRGSGEKEGTKQGQSPQEGNSAPEMIAVVVGGTSCAQFSPDIIITMCVCVCVCAVSYTNVTLPTNREV